MVWAWHRRKRDLGPLPGRAHDGPRVAQWVTKDPPRTRRFGWVPGALIREARSPSNPLHQDVDSSSPGIAKRSPCVVSNW